MKNLIRSFSILFLCLISCKGQDKDEKKQIQAKTYTAKCYGEYSTGEKLSEKDKAWSLNKNEIDNIMTLSNPITESEWHFSYPNTPCNINVKSYSYKGKKYNLQINGGSYLSLFDGKKTILLGCHLPECKKFFLKTVENMQEYDTLSLLNGSEKLGQPKQYKLNFSRTNGQDTLFVEKKGNNHWLKAKSNNKILLNKKLICDYLEIENHTKNNQAFNLKLEYTNQYKKTFRKVVIPVFYGDTDLYLERIFIATLGTSAKTGDEEWTRKEIYKKIPLKQLDLDEILESL